MIIDANRAEEYTCGSVERRCQGEGCMSWLFTLDSIETLMVTEPPSAVERSQGWKDWPPPLHPSVLASARQYMAMPGHHSGAAYPVWRWKAHRRGYCGNIRT